MVDHVSPQSTFAGLTNGTAVDAAIKRAIGSMGTPILVQVKAVHGGGVSLVGQVDVQPMVHMQDGQGKTYPHGVITGVPYLRVQGGTSALIIDPMVGDIGYVMVSGRDIQNVITSRRPSAPGSFRMHSMSDCVYVGGFLNGAPNQFIIMNGDGIRIVSPGTVRIEANAAEIACNLTVDGTITATGDVTGNGISLDNHTHTGVQTGSASTGKPQ